MDVKNAANKTVQGVVTITVQAQDTGVGLSGVPALQLVNGGNTVNLTGTGAVPAPGVTGTFTYVWPVTASTANGTWTATVTATDNIQPTPNSATASFTLDVNVNQIVGVIELENFLGTNRSVSVRAGIPGGASITKLLPLNFISGTFLAGSFPNRLALANELDVPTQKVSAFLRFGDINNLQGFVNQLSDPSALSVYLRSLIFGTVPNNGALASFAAALTTPVRNVDFWFKSTLSANALSALNAYNANNATGAAGLSSALLTEIAEVVNGGVNIYSPLRFDGVNLTQSEIDLLALGTLTPAQLADLNRQLMVSAFAQYTPGTLNPQTSGALLGAVNDTLENLLLGDLDAIAAGPSIYSPARFFATTLRSGTQALLLTNPNGAELVRLNRLLLEDAFAVSGNLNYVSGQISTATLAALENYFSDTSDTGYIAALDAALISDLNNVVNGPLVYTADRFADFYGGFPGSIVAQLPPNTVPTGPALVRLNRQLLEFAFTTPLGENLLSKSVLASYRLTDVPAGTTRVSAKTAWSLRKVLTVSLSNSEATANFINNGVPGWTSADAYLRGGDIDGSNSVNLGDYGALRSYYTHTVAADPASAQADVDGNGQVLSTDYDIIKGNWLLTGDTDF